MFRWINVNAVEAASYILPSLKRVHSEQAYTKEAKIFPALRAKAAMAVILILGVAHSISLPATALESGAMEVELPGLVLVVDTGEDLMDAVLRIENEHGDDTIIAIGDWGKWDQGSTYFNNEHYRGYMVAPYENYVIELLVLDQEDVIVAIADGDGNYTWWTTARYQNKVCGGKCTWVLLDGTSYTPACAMVPDVGGAKKCGCNPVTGGATYHSSSCGMIPQSFSSQQ